MSEELQTEEEFSAWLRRHEPPVIEVDPLEVLERLADQQTRDFSSRTTTNDRVVESHSLRGSKSGTRFWLPLALTAVLAVAVGFKLVSQSRGKGSVENENKRVEKLRPDTVLPSHRESMELAEVKAAESDAEFDLRGANPLLVASNPQQSVISDEVSFMAREAAVIRSEARAVEALLLLAEISPQTGIDICRIAELYPNSRAVKLCAATQTD
ncbi:MAG: hypothetical protein AB8B50_06415 [Pirellulaceae bacterium]